MSQTETVHTKYGEVSIETVECDSCGNTIATEDAHRFAMGEGTVHGFEDAERHGYACEHCVNEGPAGFPSKVRKCLWDEENEILFSIMFWPVFTVFSISDPGNDFGRGYALSSLGAIVYGLLIAGVVWLSI